MEFYDYLLGRYGYNEAILFDEISFDGYSLPWIKKEIGKLCKDGRLIRFEKGTYYIPKETVLGKSKLDPRKVIIRKYIRDREGTIGYFSGITFMNLIGISAQMPNIWEIYTNNEQSRVRTVPVGNQMVVLRRSRTAINNENAPTLSFLELMNCTTSKFYDQEKRESIAKYIQNNRITRKSIAEYSPYFPDKAMRTMVESGIVYGITQ